MTRPLSFIVSLLTILGFAFACYFYVDSRYAKAEEIKAVAADVHAVSQRLDYKIESDKATAMQTRLWTLEDRYGADPEKVKEPAVKQQMKELKAVLDKQNDKVKGLEGNQK